MPDASPPDPAADDRFADDLRRAAEGDAAARRRLWAEHYEMLHQCAAAWFSRQWQARGADHQVSLGATDIVNEAYCRLVERTAAIANGKAYFFRAFYTECLRIVIDYYRKTKHEKGRGPHKRVELESQFLRHHRLEADVDHLYDILAELERKDARMGQIAMLRVFGDRPSPETVGAPRALTNAEIAELLGIGLRTVEKDWAFAKAFLLKQLLDQRST